MQPVQVKKILLPTDFSEPSATAEVLGAQLAQKFGASVVLVNVAEDPYVGYATNTFPGAPINLDLDALRTEIQKGCEAKLAEWKAKLPEGVAATTRFAFGKPFVEIIRICREEKADLIVLGTHGRTGLRHMILGSVAERVVRKASVPVLTVRSGEHHFELP